MDNRDNRSNIKVLMKSHGFENVRLYNFKNGILIYYNVLCIFLRFFECKKSNCFQKILRYFDKTVPLGYHAQFNEMSEATKARILLARDLKDQVQMINKFF